MSEATNASASAPVHIVVGTPCYGGNVTHHYAISALNLQAACQRRRIGLSFKLLGNDSLITRARNVVVSQFLDEPSATHLMFIDADIGFAPERVFALLESGRDMVGAVYPMKMLDWARIAERARAGAADLKSSALTYVVDFTEPAASEGDFAKVRQIGTGFLMIRRTVFDRMAARYPGLRFNSQHRGTNRELNSPNTYAFFDCMIDPDTGAYLSEDYTFCRRWIEAGGEIWADMNSRLTHVGPVPFEGDLRSQFPPSAPDSAKE